MVSHRKFHQPRSWNIRCEDEGCCLYYRMLRYPQSGIGNHPTGSTECQPLSSTNVTCFGATDGSITITNPTGGYGTYEYTVNGGGAWQASGSFTGLGPGTYNVQIRDAAHPGCIIVLNNALLITQPAILKATVTPTMVTCNGAN